MECSGAVFSQSRQYRYFLWRRWDSKSAVAFIGLNPSHADQYISDSTLNRCVGFAKLWGLGAVYLVNLFAIITPYPAELRKSPQPIGRKNNLWLQAISIRTKLVIAAWGNNGAHLSRADEVIDFFPLLYALKITKTKAPAHPLYVQKNVSPKIFHKTKIEK